ncbi:MAG: flavocytochrome c [Oscillospiraceae bacterium]|nr:flavocytochrome c [Oscillospiraceae bacterium]
MVVGAGGAGLTSAVRATQEGAKVLVLEKMGMVGGNSLRAEGGMNAANTHYEAELGLTDSTVENYIEDTLRLGHYLADPELVRTLAENGAEAVEWLDSIGAPLPEVEATGGAQGRKYLHKPEGGLPVGEYLVDKLKQQVETLGIEVMLKTRATEILMENGQAVGVIAEDAEHIYTVRAKAVVLATGGFGANFELMASYDPSLANAVTTNHAGATGDGIALAEAVGAATVDMEQIQLHPTVIQSNGLLVSESLRSHGAILVNAEGKRFVNDMDGRDVVSQAELKQPGAYAYIIFDQKLVDEVALTHKFIAGGYTITGETYEELGQAMGLEGEAVQNFVQQMETWNASVAEGEDKDFGRKGVDQDLSVAPYYAIKIAPGIHHTMGGIKINTLAQVISTEGEVIPGLFACGETTGGIHGGNRVGGNAVADFTIFGRIAGGNAAAYAGGAELVAEEAAEEAPAEEAAAGEAQTVTVSKPGVIGDPVEVEVVADAGTIYSVTVVKNNETQGIGSIAVDQLPGKIVEAQSAEVDGVSGATMTSNAIKAAVAEALEQIGFGAAPAEAPAEEAPAEEAPAEEAPAEEAPAEEAAAGEAQTVTVTKPGVFGEDVVVEVVADAGTIYSVTVVKNNETQGIGSIAVEQLPGKIVEAQSAEVDGVSGATMTSNAIKAAVAEALEQIGFGG